MMIVLFLLLQLLLAAPASGCSLHKSVSCREVIVSSRSNYTRDVRWETASPALRFEYQYSHTDAGMLINLKAMWRVLKTEKFSTPLTAFEISLLDRTEDRLVEVRNAAIHSPVEGIRKLTDTVDFFTHFGASLEFGHYYEIELRFLPLGSNGSFKRHFSIPQLPESGQCERESSLAQDKDKYAIFVSEVRKYPITSTVLLEFYTAPKVFCFSEYTIEVMETANPIGVYAKVIVTPTTSNQVVRHEFTDLPVGIHLSIKIYPSETLRARASRCVCSNCNCLVTQTKSFMFPAPEVKESPNSAPSIAAVPADSFLSRHLTHFLLLPLLLVLIAMLAVLTWILKMTLRPHKENVKLVSEWNREEKMPIVGSQELRRNGAIWVIGLNTHEEHRFLSKLASSLHPSTRIIFAPDDLPDGENRWKWMSAVNRGVDSIILLLTESSLSLYTSGLKSTADTFETLFMEQINTLTPSDQRIVTVTLDSCNPCLFHYSSSIIYREPRDFPLLTRFLFLRGFPLSDGISPPLSPALSFRSASASEISDSVSARSSIDGQTSKDSGFISNPSPRLPRSAFPYIDTALDNHVVNPNQPLFVR